MVAPVGFVTVGTSLILAADMRGTIELSHEKKGSGEFTGVAGGSKDDGAAKYFTAPKHTIDRRPFEPIKDPLLEWRSAD